MSNSDTLTLSMAEMRKGPRWFYVISKNIGKVVYYSFSRKKANRFIKIMVKETGCSVNFDDSIFCKALEYDFRYSPKDYLIVTFVLPLLAFLAEYDPRFVNEENLNLIIVLPLISLAVYSLYNYFLSKKAYNKALKRK